MYLYHEFGVWLSPARALGSGPRGRWFESSHPDSNEEESCAFRFSVNGFQLSTLDYRSRDSHCSFTSHLTALSSPPIHILVVEDNLAHQKITEYALRKSPVPLTTHVVRDGQEALDYLFHENNYIDATLAPTPDLILLDLNLPKRDGREVLKVVKGHATMKTIPVVVVSTSDREEDVASALERGAVAYISKSSGFDSFNKQIAAVHTYALQRG